MNAETTTTNPDGSTGAPGAPRAALGASGMTPSKWTVVIVGASVAWLTFARKSFAKLG